MFFRLSRLLPSIAFLALAGLGCSKTTPDSQYPPPIGVLPVAPLPEKSGFESKTDTPAATPTQPASGAPKAIDGSLPASPPTALARSQKCADKQCRLEKYLPDPSFAKSAPAGTDSPGTLWIAEVGAGNTIIIPRHHKLELLALVVSGDAIAGGDEGGAGQKLGHWTAFRAPGVGVTLTGGTGGAKIVIALAAKSGTLAEALDQAAKKPFEVRWVKRPAALSQVSLANGKDLAWGGGAFHARIAYGGEPPIPGSLEVMQASADAAIKEHDHPTWEHIAILDGGGTMKLAGQDHGVSSGAVFDIPPGVKHAFAPSGQKPLLAVQMYTPSGPEQRFIKLAEGEPKAEPAKK
jgi:mannose-6-phosphate isomerase-like protein (cupin superfamily)